jgi:drug/metabolite transporter (DMT)-like permease
MAISLLIPLLLWYFIARRASNIAKWILVVMTLLGLLFVNLDPGQLGSLAGIASLAVTILQLVAIVLLFRADARTWLSDDADDAEAP